jgi:hypothetical protein
MSQVTIQNNFFNKEIDTDLCNLKYELEATAKVQAKHDAVQSIPITDSLYEVRLLSTIIAPKVQDVVNKIREKLLVASKITTTQQLEKTTIREIEKAKSEINEKELAIIEINKNKLGFIESVNNTNLKNLINSTSLAMAGIDALIANDSFREGGFSTISAAAMSLAVFGLIFFVTNLITPWVKKPHDATVRNFRALTICTVVFFIFLGISKLRADGLNSAISLSVNSNSQPQNTYSPWPILSVSFGIFLCMFLIHQFYWKSEEDLQKEQKDSLDYKNVIKLEKEIGMLKNQIKQTEEVLIKEKNETVTLFDYYHKLVLKAVNIDKAAQGIYKRTYSLYTSNIPDFFRFEQIINYDTEIKFFNSGN